jgi:predicted Zn-dependent protease
MTKVNFVSILLALFMLLGSVPARGIEIISKEQEIQIGRNASKELEKKYGVVRNRRVQEKLDAWGRSLARRSDRPDLPYQFKILNMKEINALSLPGGFVYVTRGLISLNLPAKEMQGVLGHEIAHAARRHVAKQLELSIGVGLLIDYLTKGKGGEQLTYQVLQLLLERGYSRDDEFDADSAGARYVKAAGYDPQGLIDFLRRLLKLEKGPNPLGKFFSTHPETQERIDRLVPLVKELKGI